MNSLAERINEHYDLITKLQFNEIPIQCKRYDVGPKQSCN